MSKFGIEQDLNIFTFETLANKEGLAEQVHIPMFGNLTKEGNPSSPWSTETDHRSSGDPRVIWPAPSLMG